MSVLTGSSVLITGGTGSFGRAFVNALVEKYHPARVVIFSRDELKQLELKSQRGFEESVRYFLGDIRDLDRLKKAFQGVDFVVHAAALKQVDTAEYNPMEFVKTNILGSENVLTAAIDCGVKKVIGLSTDKASSPINLYGATKLTADKLFVSSNHYSAAFDTTFSVVRYGNVLGSRGSVLPRFQELAQQGQPIPITDERMTRFWITIDQAVDFVESCFNNMVGGELFVPKIPSMRITDLVRAVAPSSEIVSVGIRPGEKLHEEMISVDDSRRTLELSDRYVVLPTVADWGFTQPPGTPVPNGFSYTSENNDDWLSVDDLRALISQ